MSYCTAMGHAKDALDMLKWARGVLPGLWGWFRARVIGPLPLVPSERRCFWREVTHKGRATTLAEAEFHVTNTRRTEVVLVATRLVNPPTRGAVSVKLPEANGSWWYGGLPAGAYGLAHVTFYICPPIGSAGESITADVVIVDNLGCSHRCHRVVFAPYLMHRAPAALEAPAMTQWAYIVLLLPATVPLTDDALEAAKRQALRAIAPETAPRRWFFRRFALADDHPHGADPRAFLLYVERQGDDPLPLLQPRAAAAARTVLPVQAIRAAEWDGGFGPGYGGPDGEAAMRDFCAEAAPVAIIEGRDPVAVAQRHMDLGRAPAAGIVHWWMWLRDGPLVRDEAHLWKDAVAACQAGTPPTY